MLSERSIGQNFILRRKQHANVHSHLLPAALQFSDFITVFAVGISATIFYHSIALGVDVADFGTKRYLALSFLASSGFVILGRALGGYRSISPLMTVREARSIFATWSTLLGLLVLAGFLLKNGSEFSRGTLIIFASVGYVGLLLSRWLCRESLSALMARNVVPLRKAFLIKMKSARLKRDIAEDARAYETANFGGYKLTRQDEFEISDMAHLRDIVSKIRASVSDGQTDEVLIEVDHRDLSHLGEIQDAMHLLPVPVHLVLDPVAKSIMSRSQKFVGRLFVIEIQRAPLSYLERMCKRIMDIVISITALVVLAPIMFTAASMILLETGRPIFFVQDRRGFSGRIFKIYKFRSMVVAANATSITQAKLHDPRITKVGNFIRRTSIDELPQFVNVLMGDMSIVGPRPHAVAHDDEYSCLIAEYAMRHHTKPGLTGLAQVRGLRGETPRLEDMRERIAMDIGYINQWSIWSDIAIIMRTAAVVLFQRNAR